MNRKAPRLAYFLNGRAIDLNTLQHITGGEMFEDNRASDIYADKRGRFIQVWDSYTRRPKAMHVPLSEAVNLIIDLTLEPQAQPILREALLPNYRRGMSSRN